MWRIICNRHRALIHRRLLFHFVGLLTIGDLGLVERGDNHGLLLLLGGLALLVGVLLLLGLLPLRRLGLLLGLHLLLGLLLLI